ncbi:MAG: 50S ribosomal protein L23 [Gammaproteobacteria bacterium]|nr:50S ribosomal protein L23 [Gammaproteobacteria bacterium]
MKRERLYQVLVSPIVSEKSTRLADDGNQVVFEVLPDASKGEIKEAVQLAFDVEVEQVQVANMPGKVKRFGRTPGARSNWKKAYVRLKAGQDIDFTGGQ